MAEINSILPQEIIEKNICSYCKNYLSCGPIQIHPRGIKICGRCTFKEKNPGIPSLFDKVAPYLVFPCIYNQQGCTEQLKYENVKEHEDICSKSMFHCPLCSITLKYTESFRNKLKNHFECIHPNEFLKLPEVCVNINSFETTERYLLFNKPEDFLLALLFVKFDGEFLYLNASVPFGYIPLKFKQAVNNLKIIKFCSSLGDNSDCFKFLLSRSLDCIAKIRFNVVEDLIQVSINFIPKEVKKTDAPRIKSVLDPIYIPNFYWNEELKTLYRNKFQNFGDNESFSFVKDGYNKPRIRNSSFWWYLQCSCCESYVWESSCPEIWQKIYTCDHYVVCHNCVYCNGYTKCNFNGFSFESGSYVQRQFQIFCRYNCGSSINVLELATHERSCLYNILSMLSDTEFGKLCFGTIFKEESIIERNNKLIRFDYTPGKNKSIFIVKHEDQKCIFHYLYLKGKDCFTVEHEYDRTKYNVIIRLVCRDGTIKEEQNTFFRGESTQKYFHNNQLRFTIIFVDYTKTNIKLEINNLKLP